MTGDDPEYQYHLKDHLGNVRVTFTTKEDIEENTATLETANATTEQSQFLYYDEAVKINSTLFDHTNSGATQYATRLSGSPNELTGLAKSISVMPGDTIRTEVYAKYLDGNTSNWTTALTNFMAAIAGGTAPEGTFVDGGATGSTGGTTPSFIGLLDKGDETGNAPKAYLNYLIFDKNYVLLNGGFVRMSENAREYGQDGAHEKLAAEFVITEPGYVYIYLSNDNAALGGSTTEVYFDDFMVTHTKSPVIQSNDYYPGGALFSSYQRENTIPNKFLFQETELMTDLGLNLYDFDARLYDPFTWRTPTLDPNGEGYFEMSPYSFLENNPVNMLDPSGMDAINLNGGSGRPGMAICPTCPNTPEFKPLIDDPDNVYHYDPQTGGASLVPMLDVVTITASKEWSPNWQAGLDALTGMFNPFKEKDPNDHTIYATIPDLPIGPRGGVKGIKSLINLHHSFPKFLGGLKKQKLTKMSADLHKILHKELNVFLRRYGMAPSRSNPGRLIRENHSGSKIQKVLTDFYNGPGAKFKEAAADFFKYVENLPK